MTRESACQYIPIAKHGTIRAIVHPVMQDTKLKEDFAGKNKILSKGKL